MPSKFTSWLMVLMFAVAIGCTSKAQQLDSVKPGTEITVRQPDGTETTGRIVEVKPDAVVLEAAQRTTIPRERIAAALETRTGAPLAIGPQAVATSGRTAAGPDAATRPAAFTREREVTIPAGTILPLRLETAVSSVTSHVEDPVRASVSQTVLVDGLPAIPAGSMVSGTVTSARRSGKVSGRAHVAVRFHTLTLPESDARYDIQTAAAGRTARATHKKDALTIGLPAAGGALVGALVGGKKGALIGGGVGGGAGTAVVLTTRGKEVRLGPGARMNVRLIEPLTVRVRTAG